MDSNQPRNSATHAIECFVDLLERVDSRGGDSEQIMVTRIQEALHWLKISQKFTAPVNGEFLERVDLTTEGIDFPKLPYPAICLEYNYRLLGSGGAPGVELAPTDDQPDLACVLAYYPDPALPTGELALKGYGPMTEGEFLVWPMMGFSAGRKFKETGLQEQMWVPTLDPVVLTTHLVNDWSIDFRASDRDKRLIMHCLPTEASLLSRVQSKLSRNLPVQTQRTLAKEIATDTAWEAMSIVELCNVLECTNVKTRLVEASDKLNKKRTGRGKPPLFSYHVLELVEPPSRTVGTPGGGSHSSPRQHYRRGHIRRLQSGRKTWVRPVMVGDAARGTVAKDYDARLRGQ